MGQEGLWDQPRDQGCYDSRSVLAAGSLEESHINSSLPYQTRRIEQHQDGPGCLKLLQGIKTKWEKHRGGVHPLELWTVARSLPEKLESWVTPGEETRVEL